MAVWQKCLVEKYKPEKYGLKVDGCFDYSRLKRVIGTYNHKAERNSGIVRKKKVGKSVRETILSMAIDNHWDPSFKKPNLSYQTLSSPLPVRFQNLLRWDPLVRKLWRNPDPQGDPSRHDWRLGESLY